MIQRILWMLGITLLAIVIFFLPQIASTSFGKSLFLSALKSRFGGEISIQRLQLSWLGPQHFEQIAFSKPEIAGTIGTLDSKVQLWNIAEMDSSFEVQTGFISFPLHGGATIDNIRASFSGNTLSISGSTQGGAIAINGKIFSREDFDLHANLSKVPTAALNPWLSKMPQFKKAAPQLLGDLFSLTGSLAYNQNEGFLTVDLSSSNLQTYCKATIAEDILTLNEPLTGTFRLNHSLSQTLLAQINPLFITGIEAENPIVFRIGSKNFSCPLRSFSIGNLKIGQGMIDLGKIRCKNGKSLFAILSLLKSNRLSGSEEMEAWFTPLQFKVEKGELEADRMDALFADSIHLCTWGKIDLVHNLLDMYLGLPSDTLARSFGIQNLPRNYVLKIPIEGSPQNPEIGTKAAAAKIGALIAAQQIPKKGSIFGGLFNAFAGGREDESVPPPHRPFPWE